MTSISLEGNVVSIPDQEKKRYAKDYSSGKYRTVVIVFEGKVLVSPYDDEGTDEKKAVSLTAGQTNSADGEVK